jgi:type IV pilus assembly protein PilO
VSLRDPQTQRLLLGVMLLGGLGYAFYQYLYMPKQAELTELRAQAERLESYNDTAKRAAQSDRISALEEESVSYERRLEAFEELIPTTEQVPQLLERVATAALESDVDLLSFAPVPAEPGDFYTEQLYDLEVRGGYHQIGTFLTRIATLPRIIKPAVSELIAEEVTPPGRARAVDSSGNPPPPETLVHATLQLSTYVVPGGEAPVVGADTTGGRRPIQLGAAGAGAQPTAAPSAAGSPVAPPAIQGISPGVAPAIAAERARLEAAAAQTGAGAVAPPAGAGAPNAVGVGVVPGAGGGAVGVAGAAPAGAAQPQPVAPAPSPSTPRSMPGDLPPVGERDGQAPADRAQPASLPPLGDQR